MAKIKPKTLEEIQKSLGRPDIVTGTRSELYRYASRLAKTVNSRIRRLMYLEDESYAVRSMDRRLRHMHIESMRTEAGYINVKKEGSYTKQELTKGIKVMEKFIEAKTSTKTGIEGLRDSWHAGVGSMFENISDTDLDAIYETMRRVPLNSEEYYNIMMIASKIASHPEAKFTLEDFLNNAHAYVEDSRWDRELEEKLTEIYYRTHPIDPYRYSTRSLLKIGPDY
mgnify:CR=1 FL=1